jgi:hypothetical protein
LRALLDAAFYISEAHRKIILLKEGIIDVKNIGKKFRSHILSGINDVSPKIGGDFH